MTEQQQHERVAINWFQVSGSALAAVSSAVLLSTVGVAGTIIGAALGSVVVTAGGSIYSHYLELSRQRVAAAQAVARARKSRARSARLDTRQQERAGDELHQAEQQLADAEDETVKPSWRELLTGLRWRRIATAAAVIFVAAMLIIVTFETVTGRAVSTYTGGTDGNPRSSIPGLGRRSSTSTPDRSPTPKQTQTQTPTRTPTQTSTPTTTPSPSASPSTPGPSTVSPSPTPTVSGTQTAPPTTTPRSPAPSTVPTPTPASTGTPSG
jgi:chorismate mutase